MNIHANATLIIGNGHLKQCEPEVVFELPSWGMRRMAEQCRKLADKLEGYSFTEPGADAAKLKKAAALHRNTAAMIEKMADATSNDQS